MSDINISLTDWSVGAICLAAMLVAVLAWNVSLNAPAAVQNPFNPCIGIYCQRVPSSWENDSFWLYNRSLVGSSGMCPDNLTARETVCECAKPDGEYYKRWGAPCMAYCYECLEGGGS